MKSSCNSACILFKEEESECVIKALNLIGTILSSPYYNQDSNVLLICSRESWDEAIDSIAYDLSSSFVSNRFDYSLTKSNILEVRSKDFLNNLFDHCFGQKLTHVNTPEQSINNTPHSSSPITHGDDPMEIDKDNSEDNQCNSTDFLNHLDTNTNELEPESIDSTYINEQINYDNQNVSYNEDYSEMMKRLLIRFVDDVPSRRIIDGRSVKCFNDEQINCFWNYIQATNEISIHGNAVDFVVVAGLSGIILKSVSKYSSVNTYGTTHAFSSSLISEGKIKYYHTKIISMYTMALSMTINAMHSRIKSLEEINEFDYSLFPSFILIDELPSEEEDSDKFIRFISERFGFTYIAE